MEINYKNGELVKEQNYFTTNEGIIENIILGNTVVSFEQLPKLNTKEELDLRYLNYGSKTFVVAKDTAKEISHFFMYEQKLKDNQLKVINYDYSLIVPKNHILAPLLNTDSTNDEFITKSARLLYYYLYNMNYAINSMNVYNQIMLFLELHQPNDKEQPSADTVGVEDINISKVAKEHNIPYTTLWERMRAGMTVEQAVKKDKHQVRVKRKEINYEGKNLRQLAKEYNMKYNTLWNRIHRNGMTVEQALGIEKVGEK